VSSAGLGLFVCHNLITAFGGQIEITGDRGAGTRVVVRLPLWRGRQQSAA